MTQLIVKNLDDAVQQKLLELAQSRQQTLDEFVGEVLRKVATEREAPEPNLGSRIAKRFSKIGLDADLETLPRQSVLPPSFDQ